MWSLVQVLVARRSGPGRRRALTERACASAGPTRGGRLHALDQSWLIGLLALVVGALVALGRLVIFAHGDPTWFIVAGRKYSGGITHYHKVHLFPANGYGGEFFYRLALGPLHLGTRAFGITFDYAYRAQRIGYPVLAWLLVAGRGSLVPWSLIAVNVLCLGALGWVSGAIAKDSGRHAAYGLLLVGFWGYMFSLSRDTAEIPAAAFMLAGLLALRRRRPWLAALAFGASVLTRETVLVVVAAVGLHHIWTRLRRGRTEEYPGFGAYAAWIAPGAAFLAWQAVVKARGGHLASRSDLAHNLGLPFVGIASALWRDALAVDQPPAYRDLAELIVFGALVLWAARCLRQSSNPAREKLALGLMAGLVVSLAPVNLVNRASQRSLDQLFLLASLVLLGSSRRLRSLGFAVALIWLVLAAHVVVVY